MSGFEYNGFIHRDLEPQVRYDAEQIQALKQANIDINNKIDTLPLGGEKVSLTFPAGASEGTITANQLTTLQASEANYIEMVNDKELYYLNDNGHTEGFLTYSHVGIENSKATIKTLTITVSAKSFVIVTTVIPTNIGSLYKHECVISNDSQTCNLTFFDYRSTPHTIASASKSPRIGYSLTLEAPISGTSGTYLYTGMIDTFTEDGNFKSFSIPLKSISTGGSISLSMYNTILTLFTITSINDTVTEL